MPSKSNSISFISYLPQCYLVFNDSIFEDEKQEHVKINWTFSYTLFEVYINSYIKISTQETLEIYLISSDSGFFVFHCFILTERWPAS